VNFYIIEDDVATRRMLEQIIERDGLGKVLGRAGSGQDVDGKKVQDADIILIDLLMPERDGIETIRALRREGYQGKFVMISQVNNKEMVGEAYAAGVEYYIHKPVNRLEVTSVLRRVIETLSLKKSLSAIKKSLFMIEEFPPVKKEIPFDTCVLNILTQLGGAGEAGHKDICQLFTYMNQLEQETKREMNPFPSLKDLFASYLIGEEKKSAKALEQRLRRLIYQVMTHLASIGLTDYSNPTFEYYASRLFDFEVVRQRMRELEQGVKTSKCKINMRKFLSVLYTECKIQHKNN
jgi:two-component system response regulator YcbB